MNKKMAAIFGDDAKQPASTDHQAPQSIPESEPPMAGHWGRIAYRMKDDTLSSIRENLQEGVAKGQIPLILSVDAIEDQIGSDRVTPESEDPNDPSSFAELRRNIEERGQRTPIRVRPADPTWRPNEKQPLEAKDTKFYLLSGRRRLRACKELNRDIVALVEVVSDEDLDQIELKDLQERFYENVARRDLNSFEKLASIGFMAQSIGEGKTHAEISKLLNISRPRITKGLSLIEHYDEVTEMIDASTATFREIENALAECSKRAQAAVGSSQTSTNQPNDDVKDSTSEGPAPFKDKQVGEALVSLSRNQRGLVTLRIYSRAIDEEALRKIEEILAESADD
jgi:ParB family transcriptional regulator, chromosome partitioning protein